ncbi:hypothetical protein G7059_03955 [Erysipelothrix sp. HDW6A]|uniref:UPF0236 family transposase-like protein n=1 Tax=Erysipelothrix sp. HDW6A TaxID=2714928 RepID=UPI00140A4F71|nr:UPF0236 family protein [Erysipelothrix sp. HDW6A]QIK57059.1 hypothetical protein G7059_03955 [Erysipelothrix sp. HDW6A]
MSILTQNKMSELFNLIIAKVSNNLSELTYPQGSVNGVFDYVNVIENISEVTYEAARVLLESTIEEMDYKFRYSQHRVNQFYVKCKRTRTLITPFGKVNINRTIYLDRITGKTYCYVDKKLGLPKYDRYDPCIKSMLLSLYADHNSMLKVGRIVGEKIGNAYSLSNNDSFTISRQTVFNSIRNAKMFDVSSPKQKTPTTLYIMADEKYVHLNTRKNKMVKSAVVFEGIEGSKRRVVTNKYHVMGMREMFWETVADVLHERYDAQKIKQIYFIGDGAPWIKESTKFVSLESVKSKFLLDKFHFKQALNRITKDKDIQAILQENILECQDESFDKLIGIIRSNNLERLDSINQQVKYLKNQQRSIRQAYKHNISCSMESSISHTLASNFTRNLKAYAQDNLEIYVNHRMNHLNGYNLKLLYLQGLSVNDYNGIKSLKSSDVDWSIFEKKKHQTKFDAKLYIQALIKMYD